MREIPRIVWTAVCLIAGGMIGPALAWWAVGWTIGLLIGLADAQADPETCQRQLIVTALAPPLLVVGAVILLWSNSTGPIEPGHVLFGAIVATVLGPFVVLHEALWGFGGRAAAVLSVPTFIAGILFTVIRQREQRVRIDDAPPWWVSALAMTLVIGSAAAISLGHIELVGYGDACQATRTILPIGG